MKLKKAMEATSAILCILSVLQFFFTPPGVGIGVCLFLLILGSITGEMSMSPEEQDRLLARRKMMDRHGASH